MYGWLMQWAGIAIQFGCRVSGVEADRFLQMLVFIAFRDLLLRCEGENHVYVVVAVQLL